MKKGQSSASGFGLQGQTGTANNIIFEMAGKNYGSNNVITSYSITSPSSGYDFVCSASANQYCTIGSSYFQ